MKSGNLNFLEPFGPHQAYNGAALPFITWVYIYDIEIHQSIEHCRTVENSVNDLTVAAG